MNFFILMRRQSTCPFVSPCDLRQMYRISKYNSFQDYTPPPPPPPTPLHILSYYNVALWWMRLSSIVSLR